MEHSDVPTKGRVPLPTGTVKIFNNSVLPAWLAEIFSTKDSWPTIDAHIDKLQSSWDSYLGTEHPHKLSKNTEVYHKVRVSSSINIRHLVTTDYFRRRLGYATFETG
jgi:hypothetical protein